MTRLPGDPSVAGKLAFAVGFRLRDEHRDWVRHELTDAGWRIRVVLRHLTVMIPVCVLLALLPGPPWLKIMVPALALAGSLFTVTAYADDIRAARLRQHRLPVPDDPDLGHPTHLPRLTCIPDGPPGRALRAGPGRPGQGSAPGGRGRAGTAR